MKSYTFKLSKLAFAGCIVGILLGIGGIAFTIYRMLAPSLGFSSPQLIIQHIVIIIASLLAPSARTIKLAAADQIIKGAP